MEFKLISLLGCYLRDWKLRVVLNSQTSDWRKINSDVTQGSLLGF